MPSSRPNTIPIVIEIVRQLKPRSILDVGVGFGKWGHLFREYTDILQAENDPERYQRKNWQVRIDGIEGYASYITPMHRFLYDEILIGDARKLIRTIRSYDLIFLGDIIEHFEKAEGTRLLQQAIRKAAKAVIVSTPKFDTGQAELCGNELEKHRSLWRARDFEAFKGASVKTVDGDILLAVIAKDGIRPPDFAQTRARGAALRQLQTARKQIEKVVPASDLLILVDEEQIRSQFSKRRVLPFLERNGEYWGQPADDQTAIEELERLRCKGAAYIAFIWSTRWWLENYRKFAAHLRRRYDCIAENDEVSIFTLQARKPTRRSAS